MTSSRPPTGVSAHVDTFVRDRLPPESQWPVLLYDRPELNYAPQTNVAAEVLDRHVAEGRGSRVALHTDDGSWTYERLLHVSNQLAHVLVDELGVAPGNRVLLRAPNNPDLLACWLAAVKAGAVIVATMPLLRRSELQTITDKAEIALALCDDRLTEELDGAIDACPSLERVERFSQLRSLAENKSEHFDNVSTAVDDPVLIAFTSGTTGAPKGCIHFHRDLLASADTFFRGTMPCGPDDVFAGSPPLAFTFGLGMQALFPLRIGASAALVEKPTPENLIDVCHKHRVSVLATAPTAYRNMISLLAERELPSLRVCVSAGETLPAVTSNAWHDATGIRIIDGIGATEMFHIFIASVENDIRVGATGKPVVGYEAKVFDDELNELPPGEVGRLGVRGPTGCRYLDDSRQTDYVRGGWNFTGDAYECDDDGYFWFKARADDMIISAGYNISGPEVEHALLAHEAVADCACVASPDETRGHIVKAFVVLAPDHEPGSETVALLQEFVKSRIAPYKYPRAVEFVSALPRTETGKVQRFKLRRRETERGSSA